MRREFRYPGSCFSWWPSVIAVGLTVIAGFAERQGLVGTDLVMVPALIAFTVVMFQVLAVFEVDAVLLTESGISSRSKLGRVSKPLPYESIVRVSFKHGQLLVQRSHSSSQPGFAVQGTLQDFDLFWATLLDLLEAEPSARATLLQQEALTLPGELPRAWTPIEGRRGSAIEADRLVGRFAQASLAMPLQVLGLLEAVKIGRKVWSGAPLLWFHWGFLTLVTALLLITIVRRVRLDLRLDTLTFSERWSSSEYTYDQVRFMQIFKVGWILVPGRLPGFCFLEPNLAYWLSERLDQRARASRRAGRMDDERTRDSVEASETD